MTYTERGDEVILQMTRDDYERLLFLLGISGGFIAREHGAQSKPFRDYINFINGLNTGNPHFVPYRDLDAASESPAGG
jgi:hypothetical protein